MKPTIGRIVIYCFGGKEYAAIVTRVQGESTGTIVDLRVFPPAAEKYLFGTEDLLNPEWIEQDNGSGTQWRSWKWPERV